MKMFYALSLVVMLSFPALPVGTAHASELPPACQEGLTNAHSEIAERASSLELAEAIGILKSHVAIPCGIDLDRGTPAMETTAIHEFVEYLSSSGSEVNGNDVGVQRPPGLNDRTAADLVPCTIAGAGDGTIRASVLGITLSSLVAEGEWLPTPANVTQVTGDAALLGGTQAGQTGVIRIAAAALPTTGEDSQGWCAKLKTEVGSSGSCWYLVIWWSCASATTFDSVLVSCGATARQSLLGLVEVNHIYATDHEGC